MKYLVASGASRGSFRTTKGPEIESARQNEPPARDPGGARATGAASGKAESLRGGVWQIGLAKSRKQVHEQP